MSRLQLPETIPTGWVIAGVLAVMLFVVGIFAGALLFDGGSDGGQAILETAERPTTSVTRTPRPGVGSDKDTDTATPTTSATPTPVLTAPAPTVVVVVPALTAPPKTLAPTAPPVTSAATSAPTPVPPPTARPTPSITWPEVAEGFRDQENAYYESIKTYHQQTLGPFGTVTYTNQYYLPTCSVQAWNGELWSWVIQCEIGVLATVPGFEPEYHPKGTALFRLNADSGAVVQL